MRKWISYEDYAAKDRRRQNRHAGARDRCGSGEFYGFDDGSGDSDDGQACAPYDSACSCSDSLPSEAYADAPQTCAPCPNVCPQPPRARASCLEREGKDENKDAVKTERKTGWGSLLILFLCFGIAVTCAILMSGGLSLSRLIASDKVILSARKIYCVQTAAPATAEEAAQVAKETRTKGGGGYVYVSDGLYVVLASAYENESDCDNVIEKLNFGKSAASKYCIDIPKVTLAKIKEKTARQAIESGYGAIWDTYKSLYGVTVKLDTGDLTSAAARVRAGQLINGLRERIAALAADETTAGERIRSALTAIAAQLEAQLIDSDRDDTLSVNFKYAYLKLLHEYDKLAAQIAR